jgi:hypothetical protein
MQFASAEAKPWTVDSALPGTAFKPEMPQASGALRDCDQLGAEVGRPRCCLETRQGGGKRPYPRLKRSDGVWAIDAGTSVLKCPLFAEDGRELAVARARANVERPRAGWSEQDVVEVRRGVAATVREVAKASMEEICGIVSLRKGMVAGWSMKRAGLPAMPCCGATGVPGRWWMPGGREG